MIIVSEENSIWMCDLLNSNKPFFIKIRCLKTLTPPDVDPEEPPINIIPKNNIVKKGISRN